MPTVVIREFQPGDSVAELTRLVHAGYADLGRRGFNFPGVDQTVERTAQRVSEGVCLVAECDGALVGTILVQPSFREAPSPWLTRGDAAYFMQFAVHPDWQGSGLGGQLLAQAEVLAIEAGYRWLTVDTAIAAGHIVAFYRQRGYEPVDEMQWPGKNYRGVVLAKALVAPGSPNAR